MRRRLTLILLLFTLTGAACADPGEPRTRAVTVTDAAVDASADGSAEATPAPEAAPPGAGGLGAPPSDDAGLEQDAQAGEHIVRFGAVGDIGKGTDDQRRVGDRIAAVHRERELDALLLLGDIIYPHGDRALYESRFADPWRAVLEQDIRMEVALGNHDVDWKQGADIMELFDMPGRYFSFTIGPVTFYSIDANDLDPGQIAWLTTALARSTTPWNVLFMHQPMYASGIRGSDLAVRAALEPLLRQHGVQLVLAAHEHHYERTYPIAGTVHFVVGTGCCLREAGRSSFTAVSLSEPGVAVLEFSSETALVQFVHSDGRVLDETIIPADSGVHAMTPVG